jgi:circadian clock protein KaiB
VDVYQQPGRISDDQIVAIPTLVKYQPAPLRRIIGDMSNRQRLLDGLGLVREAEAT